MVVYASGAPHENEAIFQRRLAETSEISPLRPESWRDFFDNTEDIVDVAIEAELLHYIISPTLANARTLANTGTTQTLKIAADVAQLGGTERTIADIWKPFAITDALHDVYRLLRSRPSYEEWFWSSQNVVHRVNPSRTYEDYTYTKIIEQTKGSWTQLRTWDAIASHIRASGGKIVIDGVLHHMSKNNSSGRQTISTLGILSLIQMIAPKLATKERAIPEGLYRGDSSSHRSHG